MYTHTSNTTGHTHTKTTFVLTPISELSPQSDSTNDCSAAIIARNQPSTDSNLTSTNQVDTEVNNDYYTDETTGDR